MPSGSCCWWCWAHLMGHLWPGAAQQLLQKEILHFLLKVRLKKDHIKKNPPGGKPSQSQPAVLPPKKCLRFKFLPLVSQSGACPSAGRVSPSHGTPHKAQSWGWRPLPQPAHLTQIPLLLTDVFGTWGQGLVQSQAARCAPTDCACRLSGKEREREEHSDFIKISFPAQGAAPKSQEDDSI